MCVILWHSPFCFSWPILFVADFSWSLSLLQTQGQFWRQIWPVDCFEADLILKSRWPSASAATTLSMTYRLLFYLCVFMAKYWQILTFFLASCLLTPWASLPSFCTVKLHFKITVLHSADHTAVIHTLQVSIVQISVWPNSCAHVISIHSIILLFISSFSGNISLTKKLFEKRGVCRLDLRSQCDIGSCGGYKIFWALLVILADSGCTLTGPAFVPGRHTPFVSKWKLEVKCDFIQFTCPTPKLWKTKYSSWWL